MKDFLHAIFSRGSQNTTFDPVVMVGGVNDSSASLTTDVAHFDATGNLKVNVTVGGGAGSTVSVSGTQQVNVVQWGGSNVQSASFGVPTVGWFQRLDATNDAITCYQVSTATASWIVSVRDSSGNALIATNTHPVGTEQGLIVRPINSGTSSYRIFDSSGNAIISTNTTPALSAQGVNVRPIYPTCISSTFVSVGGTTGSVVVQNTNGDRRMVVANNDSTAVMFLNYGVAAGTQTYFVRIPTLGYWEMPQPIWQGSLAVIWDSVNVGAGRFTILT